MIKTTRQFYVLVAATITALLLGAVVLLGIGDRVGQPLKVSMTFQPEGPTGVPQVLLTFQDGKKPVQAVAEAAFEISPAVAGDFSWQGATLVFTPAGRLQSDTTYRVRLRGGLQLNDAGRSAYAGLEYTFHTRLARVAFLKKEGQAVNLWISEESGDQARPLTAETNRQVTDFTVSPGGERIVYSLAEADGYQASLWLVKTDPQPGDQPRRLVEEKGIRATAPRWSPGGDLIAYERRLFVGGGAFTQPQLWLIKSDGTSLAPLYGGSERYGGNLSWAAGGSRAFFWEPTRQAVGIFNVGDEPVWKTLPGVIPQDFAVSPDGRAVIMARYDYSGATQKEVLNSLDYRKNGGGATGEWEFSTLGFSNRLGTNDSSPEWSPDGKLVAFLRQGAGPGPNSPDQIWLYEPASEKTWPLTPESADSSVSNGFQWSPDGQKILFEHLSSANRPAGNTVNKDESSIWVINTDGSAVRLVVKGGFGAKWVY